MNEAQEIRNELKQKHGWNRTQVSVRAHKHSMGCTIYISIKDLNVSISEVESITAKYAKQDHSLVKIKVNYAANKYDPLVAQIFGMIPDSPGKPGRSIQIGKYKVVYLGNSRYSYQFKDCTPVQCWSNWSCANLLVLDWLDREGKSVAEQILSIKSS